MSSEPGRGPVGVGQGPEERRPFITREERERRRRTAIESLTVGEWREGRVTSTTAFGAFVSLGDVDGLIHISQLGEGGFVERVEDIVAIGQTVRVRVVEIDPERGRVSLSMREAGAARPARAPGPMAPRPMQAGASPAVSLPAATPEEGRDPERRAGGRRVHAERATGRRREEERQRGAKKPPAEGEDGWRDLRGGSARDYAYYDADDDEEEAAPESAEELVARFSRRTPS